MDNKDFLQQIEEKHGVILTQKQAYDLIQDVAKEVSFGSCNIEEKLVRLLMALHSIDNDSECNEFYYDLQERYDDLLIQDGNEPIKDRVFSNCMTNLITSGQIQEIRTLDYKLNKVLRGYRINADFKTKIHNCVLDKLEKYKNIQ